MSNRYMFYKTLRYWIEKGYDDIEAGTYDDGRIYVIVNGEEVRPHSITLHTSLELAPGFPQPPRLDVTFR